MANTKVLILVLMEDTLGVKSGYASGDSWCVLILVLMEDTLGEQFSKMPCFRTFENDS